MSFSLSVSLVDFYMSRPFVLFFFFKCDRESTLVFGVGCLLSCAFAEISHVLAQCRPPLSLKCQEMHAWAHQRGELAALLGIRSILAASGGLTNKSFTRLAPNIIYAPAT